MLFFARPCGEMRPWWPTFGNFAAGQTFTTPGALAKMEEITCRYFFWGNRTKWRFIVGKINDKWWISQQAMFDNRRVGIRLKRGPKIVERWEVVKTRIDFTNIRGPHLTREEFYLHQQHSQSYLPWAGAVGTTYAPSRSWITVFQPEAYSYIHSYIQALLLGNLQPTWSMVYGVYGIWSSYKIDDLW